MLMLHVVETRARLVSRTFVITLAALLLVLSSLPRNNLLHNSVAAASNCQLTSVSPHSVPANSDTGFSFFFVDNVDAIAWASVTVPSAGMTIVNASSSWLPNVSATDTTATFSGSAISPGNTIEVDVEGVASSFPPGSWTVTVSTDPSGTNPFGCDGDASISITDTTPPNITNIAATALTTSATITWDTDKPSDSMVNYGLTTSYGSHVYDATLVTAGHSINLTGLTPATTYHYKVTSTDSSGNTASSIDGTFFTASIPTSTTIQSPPPINAPVTNVSDKIPPSITITSSIPKILATAPTVSGVATDNNAVVKIEYSTDGGKNWLPADTTTGLNTKRVSFSFTPLNLDDGTYTIVARATDGGGNTAMTPGTETVIDRLPPIVGGSVLTLGPQILQPDNTEAIDALAGVDMTVTLSTIGGATSVSLSAMNADSGKLITANFALRRSEDSGLWNGTISFANAGHYQLIANAIDGAGNTTTRTIANLSVTRPGLVLSPKGPVSGAKVTVYYLDTDTNSWVVWDGQAYGQPNPQTTDHQGAFRLLLPPGKYYIKATANGFIPLNSTSFTVKQAMPVAIVLQMNPRGGINSLLSPFLALSSQLPAVNRSAAALPAGFTSNVTSLIGKTLPIFSLSDTAGHQQNSVDWLSQPTVISTMSTWDPGTAAEVAALNQVAENHDVNVKPVGLEEDTARLRAYNAIDGSQLVWLADPDGTLAPLLNVGSVPTHYFVDRKGVVQKVVSGTLTAQQLLDNLSSL